METRTGRGRADAGARLRRGFTPFEPVRQDAQRQRLHTRESFGSIRTVDHDAGSYARGGHERR